jgi:hypothetical protein
MRARAFIAVIVALAEIASGARGWNKHTLQAVPH